MLPERNNSESAEEILSKRGYSLIRKLSEGGYGKVYLAEFQSKSLLRTVQVACKIIDINKTPRKFLKKFLPRELGILIKIYHPHIISILSIYQRQHNVYIFMRYAENGDLLDYILENGAVTENQARIWSRQMALALQYLHILDIGHRDLKCENILLTKHLNCKIADFGFARRIKTDDQLSMNEMSNTFCGSISYAPPEIIHGELYNPKISDIWSLGIIIFTILNKANPFDTKNIKKLYEYQMQKKWKFRSKYENIVSSEIKQLLNEMLEPNPLKRIKIEKVINSDWIAMDPKLKTLNDAEYNALKSAMNEIKNIGTNIKYNDDDHSNVDKERRQTEFSLDPLKLDEKHRNLTIYKEEEESAFNLHMIISDALEIFNNKIDI